MAKTSPPRLDEILAFHLGGKVGLRLMRALSTQRDMSLAYTPGVARVCQEIERQPELADLYTAKGNLVGVVTDGTAVLGLGDIGALAGIPVMEGKAVLFKIFGDVDGWPVPLERVRVDGMTGKTDVEKVIDATAALACMYGGINLEDIAAPACFEIERRLDAMLDIPVFHDDQWGTAIITLAGVVNYCELSGKKMGGIRIVINGAGAAGIRIADMLKEAGAANILLVDSKGVIRTSRKDLNEEKRRYAADTPLATLADAMRGADVFVGVSVKDALAPEMVASMAAWPGIFAMANPDPEITPAAVAQVLGRKPHVMATGRSDHLNQVNNVLGFPYIFRGALDVKARTITMNMKKAASRTLAELARLGNGTERIREAYGRTFDFGPEYIIPVPFDERLQDRVSAAVARAAMADGVSKYDAACDLPPMIEIELGNYVEAKVLAASFSGADLRLAVHLGGRDLAVPVGKRPVTIGDGPAFDPQEQPGKFFRRAALHYGQDRTVTLHPDGSLAAIGGQG